MIDAQGIDRSKIKEGDKITVECVVSSLGVMGNTLYCDNGATFIGALTNIIKHEPKFDPQVGDVVYSIQHGNRFIVLKRDGEMLVVDPAFVGRCDWHMSHFVAR